MTNLSTQAQELVDAFYFTFTDKRVDTYIRDVLKGQVEKENKEEYELYLKLKEKFEK